jgi:hypothetical protein
LIEVVESEKQILLQTPSGTYNNQNYILDMSIFEPGQPVVDGTLVMVEQIPGYIKKTDVSQLLQKNGYWASCKEGWGVGDWGS